MAQAETKAASSKIVTGKVRLSYVFVEEKNDDDKYSVCILIPKGDKETLAKVNAAVEAVKADPKSASTWSSKWLASFKAPLRDGDTERDTEKSPEYAGMYFINCSTKTKPDLVGLTKDEFTGKLARLEPGEVYSGCYARVSINFYAYNVDGGKGIAAGLNNIQKVDDGERLSGRADADDDFGPENDEEDGFLG